MMSLVLRIVAGVTFALAVAWIWAEPHKFDGWIASGVALVTFVGLFVTERRVRQRELSQSQVVSGKSTAIQAGGNVNIRKD